MKTKEKEADLMAQTQQRAADRAWEKIRERQIAAFKAEEQKKTERKTVGHPGLAATPAER